MSIGPEAYQYDILNPTITETGSDVSYTKVVKGFRIAVRGNNTVYHKLTEGATTYETIRPRSSNPYSLMIPVSPYSLGFFYTDAGKTEVLEILVFY